MLLWGLDLALKTFLLAIEHKLCGKHIYACIKKKYGGSVMFKDLALAAIKATYQQQW